MDVPPHVTSSGPHGAQPTTQQSHAAPPGLRLHPRQMSAAVGMGEEAQGPPLAPLHMFSLEKRGGLDAAPRPVADVT